MRLKVALMGLLASAVVAIPVVAAGVHNNGHPIGTSVVYYSDDYPPSGIFANWSSNHNWLLSFGVTEGGNNGENDEFTVVGLRIDAQASQPARSFQFDVNTANGNDPFIEVWADLPNNSAPTLQIDTDLGSLGSSQGFTFTNLHNGFTRVVFNASGNSNFPAGTTFSSIYFADFAEGPNDSFSDQITNASVNHIGVVPNIQPKPEFDSTLDF